MSVRAMAWVWEHSVAAATDRLVLLAIADCANDRGEAWPSMAALVEKTRLSERTVQRAISALVSLGELAAVIGGGRGRTTKYRLITPSDDQETPPEKPRNPDGRQRNPVSVSVNPVTLSSNPVTVTPGTIKNRQEPEEPFSSETASRPDVDEICTHLADKIESNGSKRPTITKRWRTEARLLLDADGRTVDQVIKAIDWCQADEFWRSNVLSMPKLREKYDQLRLAAQRGRASPNGNVERNGLRVRPETAQRLDDRARFVAMDREREQQAIEGGKP